MGDALHLTFSFFFLLQFCILQQTVEWLKSNAAMLGAPLLHRSAAIAASAAAASQAHTVASCVLGSRVSLLTKTPVVFLSTCLPRRKLAFSPT